MVCSPRQPMATGPSPPLPAHANRGGRGGPAARLERSCKVIDHQLLFAADGARLRPGASLRSGHGARPNPGRVGKSTSAEGMLQTHFLRWITCTFAHHISPGSARIYYTFHTPNMSSSAPSPRIFGMKKGWSSRRSHPFSVFLLLPSHVFSQVSTELHLDGTATTHHLVMLDARSRRRAIRARQV